MNTTNSVPWQLRWEGQKPKGSKTFNMTELYTTAEGHSSDPISEPLPDWDQAVHTWKWTWELHWLGIGCMFVLLAVYALSSLCSKRNGLSWRRKLSSTTINVLVFILGLSRALFLLVDPYESKIGPCKHCSTFVSRILFALGFPSLTAAFSLIHLAFLQITKLKLYPHGLQSPKLLVIVILFHYGLVFVTELLLYLYANATGMIVVSQIFYILWSSILSASFLYSGHKITSRAQASRQQVMALGAMVDSRWTRYRNWNQIRTSLPKLVRITLCTAILGLCCCVLQIYSIFGVYDMYRKPYATPNPWSWLIFQSLLRLIEFAAGCTIAYVGCRQVYVSCCAFTWCLKCIGSCSCFKSNNKASVTPQSVTTSSRRVHRVIPSDHPTGTLSERDAGLSSPSEFPSWWWI